MSIFLAAHIGVLLLLDLPDSYLIPYLIMGTASFMTTPAIKFFPYSFPKEMQERKSGSRVTHGQTQLRPQNIVTLFTHCVKFLCGYHRKGVTYSYIWYFRPKNSRKFYSPFQNPFSITLVPHRKSSSVLMLHLFSFAIKNRKKEVKRPSDMQVFLPQKKCVTGVFVMGSEMRMHPKSLYLQTYFPKFRGKLNFKFFYLV